MPGKKYTRRDRKRSTRSTTRKYKAKGGVFGFFGAKTPAIVDIEAGNVKRIKELVNAGAQVKYVVCNHHASSHRTPRVGKSPRYAAKKA